METIRTTCPSCQAKLKVPAEWAAKSFKCKKCGSVIRGKGTTTTTPAVAAKPTKASPVAAKPAKGVPISPPAAKSVAAQPAAARPASPVRPAPAPQPVPNGKPHAAPPAPGQPAAYPQPVYAYPQPAHGYPQPAHAYPPPSYGYPPPVHNGPSEELASIMPAPEVGAGRRKQKGGWIKVLAAGAVAVLLCGVAAGAIFWDTVESKVGGLFGGGAETVATETGGAPGLPQFIPTTDFPRRMLVLNVTKYLYCNNLTAGDPRLAGDHVTTVAGKLAFHWRVPTATDNNQLFIVSDTARKNPQPMLKPIIEESYKRFLETSRAQDHVVIYFGGHATTKDGQAYLVPVDGDLNEPETLVPVADLWAKLEACPAQQKVVLFDVCRLNEDGEKLRPGSEPMSEELQKLLTAAPAGVQVVLSCSAGENALEFRRTQASDPGLNDVAGSAFLSALKHIASKGKAKSPDGPSPDASLPVGPWVEAAQTRLRDIAQLSGESPQTTKLAGPAMAESPIPADKTVAAATRFDPPAPPPGMSPRQLAPVMTRARLAPIKPSAGGAEEPRIEDIIPFSETVMTPYMPDNVAESAIRADPGKYPVRNLTLEALGIIRTEWGGTDNAPVDMPDMGMAATPVSLRVLFQGETDDDAKKEITGEQEKPAVIILLLEDIVRRMDEAVESGALDKEASLYWRVMFEYAHAQAMARLAFMHEYNLALAYIRTDSLPPKGKNDTGWQMVSVEKMKSRSDVRDIAEIAVEKFEDIAEAHKGTPWAVLSKQSATVALGLEWQTYNPGGAVVTAEE